MTRKHKMDQGKLDKENKEIFAKIDISSKIMHNTFLSEYTNLLDDVTMENVNDFTMEIETENLVYSAFILFSFVYSKPKLNQSCFADRMHSHF